jgi:hypothetical protein
LLTAGLACPALASPVGAAGTGPATVAVPVAASGPVVPGVPAAPGVPGAPSTPGAPVQEDGLETRTASTYVVDPAAAVVRVSVEVTVTNQIPNRNAGGVIEQAYFSEIGVPVLTEAANFVAARSVGGNATVTPRDVGNPYVRSAVVDLEPNLFYGQTQTITLTYDLPNQPPRAPAVSRANDAFVTFPAFSFGDPGLGRLEVRVPERYEVEVVGAELTEATREGHTVLTAENIETPDMFLAMIVGTDDEKLVAKQADVDDARVEVRAWPNDAEWADFAAAQVADAKPVLEDLIGLPWPSEEELAIVETAGPYAYGYAGWYSETDHTISVGDELDPRVMVHELSHVWFNSKLFADRWVAEGFAEEYASTALDQLDQPQDGATAPDPRAPGAVALNDWSDPFLLDDTSEATEAYGYGAAWYVIDRVAEEVGLEELEAVLAAADAQTITYAGDPEPEGMAGALNWQRLLDLLEDTAGSTEAAELWDAYVVNEEQRAQLAERAEARTAYQALADEGGEWTPPLEVRRVMATWEFASLDDAAAEAEAVLAVRDDIEAALEGLGVDELGLEDAYEAADNTEDVLPVAEDTLEAAEAYAAADRRMDEGEGPLGVVGLLWSGTDDRLDTARRELEGGDPAASLRASRAVERRLDTAGRDGAIRVAAVVLVLGVLLFAGLRYRRWRKARRRRKAEKMADEKIASLPAFASLDPLGSTGSSADPADTIDAPEGAAGGAGGAATTAPQPGAGGSGRGRDGDDTRPSITPL